jgi:hypothetical protein
MTRIRGAWSPLALAAALAFAVCGGAAAAGTDVGASVAVAAAPVHAVHVVLSHRLPAAATVIDKRSGGAAAASALTVGATTDTARLVGAVAVPTFRARGTHVSPGAPRAPPAGRDH